MVHECVDGDIRGASSLHSTLIWNIYHSNSIYSILQEAGPSNSPLLLEGPHPVSSPLMRNISKRAPGQPPSGWYVQSTRDSQPLPSRCWCRSQHHCCSFSAPLSWVFRGRSASLMPGPSLSALWQTHPGFTNDYPRGPFIQS